MSNEKTRALLPGPVVLGNQLVAEVPVGVIKLDCCGHEVAASNTVADAGDEIERLHIVGAFALVVNAPFLIVNFKHVDCPRKEVRSRDYSRLPLLLLERDGLAA